MLISTKYLINLFIFVGIFLGKYFLPTLPSKYGIMKLLWRVTSQGDFITQAC